MHGKTLLLFSFFAPAFGQMPVDPSRIPNVQRLFQAIAPPSTLHCIFQSVPSALTYSLRYDAGYTLQFPKGEFTGSGHVLDLALKVSAANGVGPALYFGSHVILTNPWNVSGNLRLDPGSYRVESIATDEGGRFCRADWKLDVRPSISLTSNPKPSPARVTIFLDATPSNIRTLTLTPDDMTMLSGAVSAIVRSFSGASIRLVVLNLDLRKEFLRVEAFTRTDSRRLRSALGSIQIATVDYRDKPATPAEYLTGLLTREMEDHAGTVIFIGSSSRTHQGFPPNAFSGPPRELPNCYYLEYRPSRLTFDSLHEPDDIGSELHQYSKPTTPPPLISETPVDLSPDSIERLMQKVHGHTLTFASPAEFARALRRLIDRP